MPGPLLQHTAIIGIPTLVTLFVVLGNLEIISSAFSEEPASRAGSCFWGVLGTTFTKLAIVLSIVAVTVISFSKSGWSDYVEALFGTVIGSTLLGLLLGLFPAAAAALGAKRSESISKIAMSCIAAGELGVVLLTVYSTLIPSLRL